MLKTDGFDKKFATLKAEDLEGKVIEYESTYIAIHTKAEHIFGGTTGIQQDLEM